MHVVVDGEGSRSFARVLNHPLDRYLRREEITLEQHKAGENLFNDYQVSHAHQGTLIGEERGRGLQHIDFDNPHTAFERYMRALTALGRVGSILALHVVIEGFALKEIHTKMGWRADNSGMDRLIEVLDDLIAFYAAERRQASMDRKRARESHKNPVD
jgi:hypothetical protein